MRAATTSGIGGIDGSFSVVSTSVFTLSPTDSPRSPPQVLGVQSASEVHEFPSFGPPWHFRSLIALSMSLALTMPTSAT